jgi:type IV pilus assembly protein PilW
MRQRGAVGLALPELMVALAIGVLLILAASTLLMLTRSTYLITDDRARIEESGRFALDILSREIRQAGYRDWNAAGVIDSGWPAVSGLDARSLKDAADGIAGPYGAAINGSDVLALRFDGGSGGSGEAPMKNCAGASVPADGPGAGWSIFYVANDSLGEPELRCKYRTASGWNSDALVRGVDGFQVLYGLDPESAGSGPRRFVRAGAMAQEADGWQRVSAIRVALLLRGSQAGPARAHRYDLFGAGYPDAADVGVRIDEAQFPLASRGLMRRIYSATVALRNRTGSGA